jgi:hypothetical protein
MTAAMTQPPFAIGDEVVFIEAPAPTPERVVNITWIDAAPIPHWQAETAWQAEHHRVANADELRRAGSDVKSEAGRPRYNLDEVLARRNPELLARMNAEFEAMSDDELAVVAGLAPAGSDIKSAELLPAPESEHVAFVSVIRWALTLRCERGVNHVSEATIEHIVEAAWCAFQEMVYADL